MSCTAQVYHNRWAQAVADLGAPFSFRAVLATSSVMAVDFLQGRPKVEAVGPTLEILGASLDLNGKVRTGSGCLSAAKALDALVKIRHQTRP